MPGGGPKASQRPSVQHAGKRKSKELASSCESFEHVNRHPAPLPASALAITREQGADSRPQLGAPEGGVIVLTRPVAPMFNNIKQVNAKNKSISLTINNLLEVAAK